MNVHSLEKFRNFSVFFCSNASLNVCICKYSNKLPVSPKKFCSRLQGKAELMRA